MAPAPPSLNHDTPELAEHYDRISVERQLKAGKLLVQRIGIQPGARVLDLGCGTGLLADYVANLVGPSGHVHGVDPLPLRIAIAERKARPNLSFAVDEAYGLQSLPSESFDVVYLNAVFHWLPEKLAPLRNIHRLLKVGGKLGIATVSKDHPTIIQRALEKVLSQPAYREYLQTRVGILHRVSRDELESMLQDTGFENASVVLETNVTQHTSAEAALRHAEASSFGNLLADLPAEVRDRARAEVAADLESLVTPQGLPHEGARIYAIATKP